MKEMKNVFYHLYNVTQNSNGRVPLATRLAGVMLGFQALCYVAHSTKQKRKLGVYSQRSAAVTSVSTRSNGCATEAHFYSHRPVFVLGQVVTRWSTRWAASRRLVHSEWWKLQQEA